MCQREISHYGPEYEDYVDRAACPRPCRDALQLPYSGESPRTARERFRIKLLNNLISRHPKSSLQNNYASFRESRIRTEPTKIRLPESPYRTRPGVPLATYPSLVPSLGFEHFVPQSTAAYSRPHQAPRTYEDVHCVCQHFKAKTSFGQPASRDFRAQTFNENIRMFTDQGTMTPRVMDASCGMSTPRYSAISLDGSFCSADRHDTIEQPTKSAMFGRSSFVQSMDRVHVSRQTHSKAARKSSPGRNESPRMKAIKIPTREKSEEIFHSNENSRIMTQRSGRHLCNEGIDAVFDVEQPSESRRSRSRSLTRSPSPKPIRCFAEKASVGCYVDRHPIPHSHNPSKYHGNCQPDVPCAKHKLDWTDPSGNKVLSRGIKLPKRLLASDKSVDYYDRRRL